jgi:hypothetical protein
VARVSCLLSSFEPQRRKDAKAALFYRRGRGAFSIAWSTVIACPCSQAVVYAASLSWTRAAAWIAPAIALLSFNNSLANIPIKANELLIYGTQRLKLSCTDALFHINKQRRIVYRFDGAHTILNFNVANVPLADMSVMYNIT